MKIKADFALNTGKVKPMHAVNNGPSYPFGNVTSQNLSNLEDYRAAGIPFARTHDASFYARYGGEHTVDIHAIFPDFNKDENDPASYDFIMTDVYMQMIMEGGARVFYRLGCRIEHESKKYGTLPPKNFHKWARICEHIIRHYNEGWADGFTMDIPYWEIWNEPDGAPDDADYVDKKCWGGTQAQFCELFEITAKHLKKCFPDLKIGGPAVCYPENPWNDGFLQYCQIHDVPMDFFSWHGYHSSPKQMIEAEKNARDLLNRYGYDKTESIYNEWNYVRGWGGEDWEYSLRTEKNLKGSSFIAGGIAVSQYQPVDLLMYYDCRPCGMNGMFDTDFLEKLKGYYPFRMFNQLYQMDHAVEVSPEHEDLYAVAAASDDKAGVMFTYYSDNDDSKPLPVELNLRHLHFPNGAKITYYLLDAAHDAEPVREDYTYADEYTGYLTADLFSTYLVTVTAL